MRYSEPIWAEDRGLDFDSGGGIEELLPSWAFISASKLIVTVGSASDHDRGLYLRGVV